MSCAPTRPPALSPRVTEKGRMSGCHTLELGRDSGQMGSRAKGYQCGRVSVEGEGPGVPDLSPFPSRISELLLV